MITFMSRTIGVLVVVGLAVIGADTLIHQIALWKDAYERLNFKGTTIINSQE